VKQISLSRSCRLVGKTVTDDHKRPCWAYKASDWYIVLTTATVPRQGYFYYFEKSRVRKTLGKLPLGVPMGFKSFSKILRMVEGSSVTGYMMVRRADYFVQLLKAMGRAKFVGRSGRELRYEII
jgi:hypothetical protein